MVMIAPTFSNAQCGGVSATTDEFTGVRKIETKSSKIARGLVFASGLKIDNDLLAFMIACEDLGCVTNESLAYIKFIDGSVITIAHTGQTNCGQSSAFGLLLTFEQQTKLASVEVDKMRLSGTQKSIDFEVTNKRYFIDVLYCLTNNQ